MLVVADSDMYPLVTVLAVLIESCPLLVVAVAKILANEVSRRVMRSVPSRDLSIGNLPKLKCLSTTFEGDKFLSKGIIPPLWQQDRPEVVVQGTHDDTINWLAPDLWD